ncbi:hypothetical protein [Devosia sp. Naph2]|uniref:hypothetical protein n=1 Tax=Devosia polycyclovorans TaxID=3345148 RepID=UPI0035CE8FBA
MARNKLNETKIKALVAPGIYLGRNRYRRQMEPSHPPLSGHQPGPPPRRRHHRKLARAIFLSSIDATLRSLYEDKTMQLDWTTVDLRRVSGNKIEGIEDVRYLKERYVYVIETPKSLAIRYDKGISNVCYIGRQGYRSNGDRLHAHAKNWISKFLILSQGDEPFRLHYCHPRRKNFFDAYADIEALLIREFADEFGRAPIFNKRSERERGTYEVNFNASFREPRPLTGAYAIDARKNVEPDILE